MADQEVLAYCVKEKAKKPMKDAHEVTLKNGKLAMQGTCSSCGTKMMKFVSAKKAGQEPAAAKPTPTTLVPEKPHTAAKSEPVTAVPEKEHTGA